MKRFYVLAAAAIISILNSSSALRAQEYEIRLNRRYNVGEKYRLSASAHHSEKMVALINNTPVNQKVDEFSIDLSASIVALAIDGLGRMANFEMQIESCVGGVAGANMVLFPAGTIINGKTENNRVVLARDNVPLDDLAAKMIHLVIPAHTSGVTDDDVFGTRERKSVGDTWSIQVDVAKKSLKDAFNMQGDIKGATTLDGVVKGGGGDFLIINAWLNMDNMNLPVPDGVKIQNGQAKGTFSGRFPIREGPQPLSQSMKMLAWFVANRPADAQSPEVVVQGAIERSLKREFEPMK